MAHIDFLLSNNRHHASMLAPVAEQLASRDGARCRILSLCELRGLPSPRDRFDVPGVRFHRLLPIPVRRGAIGHIANSVKRSPGRHSTARSLVWRFALYPRLAAFWARPPDVVVTPNDAAFPYDSIVALARRREIPVVLVQEGIRFPLPGVPIDQSYGAGGAQAIAAWGASSAEYFESVGARASQIHQTGNPRFDVISRRTTVPGQHRSRTLLLLTNPIDELGLCSREEKYALVRRFIDGIEQLVENGHLRVVLKLHSGESVAEYQRALGSLPACLRIEIVSEAALYPLFAEADAAVILASTVGLEALLFGVPLGVLEIPGSGFVFDYVSRGAALGLTWNRPIADQVRKLLDGGSTQTGEYLSGHLAVLDNSTLEVARVIHATIPGNRSTA